MEVNLATFYPRTKRRSLIDFVGANQEMKLSLLQDGWCCH